MHRLLTIALSGLLVVPLVGMSSGPVQADPPLIVPVVTLEVSPGQVPAGDVVHLTATVERPASDPGPAVPGQVRFSVAALRANLWEDAAEFGPVPLSEGVADFDFQILAHDLPFLTPEDTELWVSARYEPAAGDSAPEFDYAEGTPQQVTIGPLITTTTVTGPASATEGSPTTLTASVSPATAMGTVQFLVDGSPVGSPVSLASGTASLPHTFASAGTATVGALYTSEQAGVWADSQNLPGLSVTVTGTTPPPPPPPAPTATTTTVTGPTTATVGTPTTLSASVSPATAAGTVQFSVDGAPVGSPVAVSGGSASTSHTFAVGGVRQLGASFVPADPTAYVGSADSSGLAVSVDPSSTTITITGPDAAKVGEASTLSATVQPAQATGSIGFYVNGDRVAEVALDGGSASTSYTFASEGESSVGAVFEPAEAGTYLPATAAPRVVDVEPGTSSETGTESVSTVDVVSETDDCSGGRTSARVVGEGTVLRLRSPIDDLLSYLSGVFVNVTAVFQTFLPGSLTPFWENLPMQFLNSFSSFLPGSFHIGPYAGGPCGRGQGAEPASRTDGTVQCVPVDGVGYWCPIDVPAGSQLTLSLSVPLPPQAAGKRVMVKTILKKVDPETGELVRIGDGRTKTDVPERTTLSARLAPVKSDLESVPPGGSVDYRLLVRNTGRVSADRVRTCVNLGKGAQVVDAKGAEVDARRACWTLRDVGKGESVTRKLTLRAPDAAGPLRIVATVNPRKGQADPLRLTTVLPVR